MGHRSTQILQRYFRNRVIAVQLIVSLFALPQAVAAEPLPAITVTEASQAILRYLDSKQAKGATWIQLSKEFLERQEAIVDKTTGKFSWGPWTVDPSDGHSSLQTSLEKEIAYRLDGKMKFADGKWELTDIKITSIRVRSMK